jgi:hypothetical protein
LSYTFALRIGDAHRDSPFALKYFRLDHRITVFLYRPEMPVKNINKYFNQLYAQAQFEIYRYVYVLICSIYLMQEKKITAELHGD